MSETKLDSSDCSVWGKIALCYRWQVRWPVIRRELREMLHVWKVGALCLIAMVFSPFCLIYDFTLDPLRIALTAKPEKLDQIRKVMTQNTNDMPPERQASSDCSE